MHDASAEYVKIPNADLDPSNISPIHQPEAVAGEKPLEVPAPVPVSHEHSNPSPAADTPDVQLRMNDLTKAQRRRRKRKEREVQDRAEERAIQVALEASPESDRCEMAAPQAEAGPSQVQPSTIVRSPQNLPSNEPASLSSEQTGSSEKSNLITVTMSSPPPVNDPTSNRRRGALALKAGLVTQGVSCMPCSLT